MRGVTIPMHLVHSATASNLVSVLSKPYIISGRLGLWKETMFYIMNESRFVCCGPANDRTSCPVGSRTAKPCAHGCSAVEVGCIYATQPVG